MEKKQTANKQLAQCSRTFSHHLSLNMNLYFLVFYVCRLVRAALQLTSDSSINLQSQVKSRKVDTDDLHSDELLIWKLERL